MGALISKILNDVVKHGLEYTLYQTMRSSQDFADVQSALNDRTDWSIEIFRSCLAIHFSNSNYFFTLCTLSFLVMAESIHIHYGRLSPAELKERAGTMGYATFAILCAILDMGFIVVRVAVFVTLSRTPGVAASLVLVSMIPSFVLLLLAYAAKFTGRRRRAPRAELESGIVVDETQNL